jgi:hypothetical protein
MDLKNWCNASRANQIGGGAARTKCDPPNGGAKGVIRTAQ